MGGGLRSKIPYLFEKPILGYRKDKKGPDSTPLNQKNPGYPL